MSANRRVPLGSGGETGGRPTGKAKDLFTTLNFWIKRTAVEREEHKLGCRGIPLLFLLKQRIEILDLFCKCLFRDGLDLEDTFTLGLGNLDPVQQKRC